MYVKNSTQPCKVLPDFHHEDHEALWADLRPIRLPRGFSNIIVGVVYQPPDVNDTAMRDYLVTSFVSLDAKYLNCAIILASTERFSLWSIRLLKPLTSILLLHFQLEVIELWIKFSPTFLNFSLLQSAFLYMVFLTTCLCIWGRVSGRRPLSLNARQSSAETRDLVKEQVWADFFFKCPGLTFSHLIYHVNSSLALSLTLSSLG